MFGHRKGSGLLSGGGGMPLESRHLNLVASEGFSGNGMATIGIDNNFSVVAHLPPTHTMSPHAPAVYAAYLVDGKGKNGFYAGTLKPAGNGVYQASFRSPVPLAHYNKVVVSLENPQGISQAPQGPIVMKVKEGLLDGIGPVKEKGSEVWGKVKGFFTDRFGGGQEEVPQDYPEQTYQPQQPPAQQYPNSQYSGQQYSPQAQQYPRQGGYPPQGGYSVPQQGGYPPQGYPSQGGNQQRFSAQPNQRMFGIGRPYQGQYPYGQTQPQPAPSQTYTQPVTPRPTETSPVPEPAPTSQAQNFTVTQGESQVNPIQPQESQPTAEVKSE
ncbi:MAG: hypothetical protein APF84_14470 [Gracilibacter sp. BRH_c7a]|nr:MAG: hypothetical protein APF84_14470 [Gracilibacter sp. BRH_c7a]